MTFLEKVKTPIFWIKTFKISILFLLFNSFTSILKFDLEAVNAQNFSDGKWIKFFQIKAIFSIVYSMWMTNKNMK